MKSFFHGMLQASSRITYFICFLSHTFKTTNAYPSSKNFTDCVSSHPAEQLVFRGHHHLGSDDFNSEKPGIPTSCCQNEPANSRGSQRRKKSFFVARYPATHKHTYILWLESNRLWILDTDNSEANFWYWAIQFPRNGTRLDLQRDVIPTDEEVGTSTYLVSQPWIDSIIYDAVMNGDLILIEKENRAP